MSSYSYGYRSGSYNYGSSNQIRVKSENHNPLDTVKQIVWNKYNTSKKMFLTCGWDGMVRCYEIVGSSSEEIVRNWEFFLEHPVMSLDVNADNIVFAGVATGDVVAVNMGTNQVVCLGNHNAPVCKVFWVDRYSSLISVGYDLSLKFWGLSQNNGSYLLKEFPLPEKTHTAAFDFPYMIIGSAEQNIVIFSVENPQNIKIPRYQKCNNSNGVGIFSKFCDGAIMAYPQRKFDLVTTDGRNVWGEFDQYQGEIKINFPAVKISRIQRKNKEGSDYGPTKGALGQANSIDIGSHDGVPFTIVGGTYDVAIFNMQKSQRSVQLKKYGSTTNNPVTAVKYSPEHNIVVYAFGVDWLQGVEDLKTAKRPKIYAYKMSKEDLVKSVARS